VRERPLRQNGIVFVSDSPKKIEIVEVRPLEMVAIATSMQ
jgi:hypothetical protein